MLCFYPGQMQDLEWKGDFFVLLGTMRVHLNSKKLSTSVSLCFRFYDFVGLLGDVRRQVRCIKVGVPN